MFESGSFALSNFPQFNLDQNSDRRPAGDRQHERAAVMVGDLGSILKKGRVLESKNNLGGKSQRCVAAAKGKVRQSRR